jgi:acyl-coenzyme A thioesterase PaaI-like protein
MGNGDINMTFDQYIGVTYGKDFENAHEARIDTEPHHLNPTGNINGVGGTITARAEPVRVGRRIVVIRTSSYGDKNLLLAEITTTHVPVIASPPLQSS